MIFAAILFLIAAGIIAKALRRANEVQTQQLAKIGELIADQNLLLTEQTAMMRVTSTK